jgi:hypothetical protein
MEMNEKKAGDILYRYLQKTYSKLGKTYSEMFRSWENIVGDKLKDHSRIKELTKGSVLIEVDHPAYFQLLQMDKNKILYKLQKNYPELTIKRLKIVLADRQPAIKSDINEKTTKNDEQHDKLEKEEFNKLMNKLKAAITDNTEKN